MFRSLTIILCLLIPLGTGSLAWGDAAPTAKALPVVPLPNNPHSNAPACPVDKTKLEDECNPPPRAPPCETCHSKSATAEKS